MERDCCLYRAVSCAFLQQSSALVMAPGCSGLHLHCLSCSTRLEMGKWMEDLNMAIEMAKKSTEKSDMLLENSVCHRSNSKWCFLPSGKASVVMSFSFCLLWIWSHKWSVFIIHIVMDSYCAFVFFQLKDICVSSQTDVPGNFKCRRGVRVAELLTLEGPYSSLA